MLSQNTINFFAKKSFNFYTSDNISIKLNGTSTIFKMFHISDLITESKSFNINRYNINIFKLIINNSFLNNS